MSRILSTRALRGLRGDFERKAEELVERLVAKGSFDAVRDLAEVYPLRVFPDAVGLPEKGREYLLPYGNLAFNAFGPRNELLARSMDNADEIQAAIMKLTRRESLRPGGFGAQIWAAADAGEIPHEEAPLLVRSLLTAGVDTTVNGISGALYCAASFPDQWRLVQEKPAMARLAFEEAVRFESPVQTFFRTVAKDTERGGVHLPEGGKILLFLGSANHDPRRFEDPDRYNITRKVSGHVGFGMGVHQCVGQHVARLEGEIVLTALARRVERIEISGRPERRLNNTLRAWDSLPVTVHPA
jgi:cytochrome P450